jgi:hypothetical protein
MQQSQTPLDEMSAIGAANRAKVDFVIVSFGLAVNVLAQQNFASKPWLSGCRNAAHARAYDDGSSGGGHPF